MSGRHSINSAALVAALLLGGLDGPAALGQSIERGVSVTGPGGRTVERQVKRGRGPGTVSRELEIRRPSGTIEREVSIRRLPAGYGGPPGPPRPAAIGGYPRRGPLIIERNVVVERSAGFGLGVGPFFSFAFGSPPPPPEPVFVAPAPVVVAPVAPVVVQPAPVVVETPQPIAVRPVFDPYTDALGRLASRHDNSRRDGALTLGRIGDPRAVPALVELLQNDRDDDVRIAAAQALGSIGDPRTAPVLEYSAYRDSDRHVRKAASIAYAKLPPPEVVYEETGPSAADAVGNLDASSIPTSEPPPPPESPARSFGIEPLEEPTGLDAPPLTPPSELP